MSQIRHPELVNAIRPPGTMNIYGDYGPLCPACSGLGRLFEMSTHRVVRDTSRCLLCGGTGVNHSILSQPGRVIFESQYRDFLISRSTLDQGKMSRQYWMECISWATSSGVAVANTTTETILFPNVTIPANYMQDGRCLMLRVKGQHSTLGSGTVTLLFTVRWGGVSGTIIAKTAAITQLISLTAAYWEFELDMQTRSNGSAGTVMANGEARVFGATAPTIGSATGAPAIGPITNGGQITPATATLDLTADTALSVTVTHGAASASNTVTGLQYIIISKN